MLIHDNSLVSRATCAHHHFYRSYIFRHLYQFQSNALLLRLAYVLAGRVSRAEAWPRNIPDWVE
jgi:hypothetical protein